eukprot:CAMPEP_0168791430 /NCGR_PEP_ID=MMETSP0725-20121227/13967_1 /TAXON_ID=265536 /ORGANISM="Amphiprora sp., Strain CCMP467" /LENGTH=63 /DNA_ID=CAMNT_0008841977 /DNA_START=144 /DNA_END=332 /DNA_ORIENTATION=+
MTPTATARSAQFSFAHQFDTIRRFGTSNFAAHRQFVIVIVTVFDSVVVIATIVIVFRLLRRRL